LTFLMGGGAVFVVVRPFFRFLVLFVARHGPILAQNSPVLF
jgi:hypothetical protein